VQTSRTVRPEATECPREPRGLSGPTPRTVRLSTQNTQKRPEKNGPSAKAGRTVRATRGPSATQARTVRKLAATKTKSQTGSKTKVCKNTTNTRRTLAARTVRQHPADGPPGADRAETARPRKSTPPNHHRISQIVEAMETRVWGLEKCHTRML
jgi:hypothetical protein